MTKSRVKQRLLPQDIAQKTGLVTSCIDLFTPAFSHEEHSMISLKVNGKPHRVDVDSATPLLWVIREQLGLTGTKYGCGVAQCGACTVLIDGQAQRSCAYPVGAVGKQSVETIESLAKGGQLTKV